MKHIIVNIRGNSGSGKTTLARAFWALAIGGPEVYSDEPDQLFHYAGQSWALLGKYATACGGCDSIPTQAEIVRRVEYYTRNKMNVFLEGLLMSGMYGTVGKYSEQFGDRWIFAFLDTPLEQCLKHIRMRRKAAGNDKPLNETNTRARHVTIARTQERIAAMGRRVVTLKWDKDPLKQLLKEIAK